MHIPGLRVALFSPAKNLKKKKKPQMSISSRMDKYWSIHITVHYSTVGMSQLQSPPAAGLKAQHHSPEYREQSVRCHSHQVQNSGEWLSLVSWTWSGTQGKFPNSAGILFSHPGTGHKSVHKNSTSCTSILKLF